MAVLRPYSDCNDAISASALIKVLKSILFKCYTSALDCSLIYNLEKEEEF